MKSFIAALLLGLTAQVVSGHYIFPMLSVKGTTTPHWQYVRPTNNQNGRDPVEDVTDLNMRCRNVGVENTADTLVISAGEQLGFTTSWYVYHESVTNFYMAKAPEDVDVRDWEADGEVWFKVAQISAYPGIDRDGQKALLFSSQNQYTLNMTLPSALPNGQYLVRVENIGIQIATSPGTAQFYIACAQIEVVNGGNGLLSQQKVAIPGVYTGQEPGLVIPQGIFPPGGIMEYESIHPGPAVWTGSG